MIFGHITAVKTCTLPGNLLIVLNNREYTSKFYFQTVIVGMIHTFLVIS